MKLLLVPIAAVLYFGSFAVGFQKGGPPPKPYNVDGAQSRNSALTLTINPVNGSFQEPNGKISGTNVNFDAIVTVNETQLPWLPPPPLPQPQDWTDLFINDIRLKIGGETVYEITGQWIHQEALGSIITKHVRFASTKFFDNNTINLELYAKATFQVIVGNEIIESQVLTPPTLTIPLKIYNKAAFLATKEYWDNGWQVDENCYQATTAKACIDAAIPKFAGDTGMRHAVDPSSGLAAQELRAIHMETRFRDNTVFFTVTHGLADSVGIRASYADNMFWSWIGEKVADGRIPPQTIPKYNFVGIIACSTFPMNQPSAAASAFGIPQGNPPTAVDQAIMLFRADLGANDLNAEALPQWTEKYLGYLKSGYTVKNAEEIVYLVDGIVIRDPSGQAVRPTFVGDDYTKLMGYYRSPEGETPWCRVL